MLRKSVDWFLYDIGLRHERVKLINDIYIFNNETETSSVEITNSKSSYWRLQTTKRRYESV